MRKHLVYILCIALLSGCAHVITQELREQADKNLSPDLLFKNPDAHKGKMVILGGVIISTMNTGEGTYIEVLQKPLNNMGRPQDTDFTYGRFIIMQKGFLDPAVYASNKEITVAGEVAGKIIRPLGEIQYPYVLIFSRELHLFESSRFLPIGISFGIGATF